MSDTRRRIVLEAETLLRTVGYRSFGLAELSERIGIRKASLFHHFETKEAIARIVLSDYRARFEGELAGHAAGEPDAVERLRFFARAFSASLEGGLLPLCCALAVESAALPAALRDALRDFFGFQLGWLTRVIEDGARAGRLSPDRPADEAAIVVLSGLEGAASLAWALKDSRPVEVVLDALLATLTA